jgi:hypothetical protein
LLIAFWVIKFSEELMRIKFFAFKFLFLLIVGIIGCAQTKQYTPQPVGTQYSLAGMPIDIVRVQVNDLRAEKEGSEQLVQTIKGQILCALSPEKVTGSGSFYNLRVDIIEHRSFFTLGNWNASTKLRIKLLDSQGKIIGEWRAEGSSSRANMGGYSTAKAVSQDAYNIAISDMMSTLSTVSLAR